MTFGVDIETIPDLSMTHLLPEIEGDKRIKDKEKLQIDLEIKKQRQISNMALNPLFAKIICICLWSPEEQYSLMGDEAEIISKFWKISNKHTIVTYNGKRFDMEVILKRGLKYNSVNFLLNRQLIEQYKTGRHIDIMQQFSPNGNFEKLDILAKIYLDESKKDIDFKEFPELLKTEEGRQKISTYCMQDAKIVYKLAEKMGFYL